MRFQSESVVEDIWFKDDRHTRKKPNDINNLFQEDKLR